MGFSKPHGDFRPDLLQDVDFFMHMHMPLYQKCKLNQIILRDWQRESENVDKKIKNGRKFEIYPEYLWDCAE